MKSVVVVVIALSTLFFAAPCLAEGETAREHSGGILRSAVADAFEMAVLQDPAGRAEWQARLDQAQDRRSKGIRYLFVGIGMGVGGSVIMAAGSTNVLSVNRLGQLEDSGSGLRAVGALTALGGAGVFWYGVYNWLKGGDEVDNLDREGRAKGYLTLVPMPGGGAQLAMRLQF